MAKKPRLFHRYKGITLYHVWRFCGRITRDFWLATDRQGALREIYQSAPTAVWRSAFDIRLLPDAYCEGVDLEKLRLTPFGAAGDARPWIEAFIDADRLYWQTVREIVCRAIDDGFDFTRCGPGGDICEAHEAKAGRPPEPSGTAPFDDEIPF